MVKKIGYILILLVSMFFINSVKAGVTCSKINDMEYGFVFDDNGSLAEVIKSSGAVKPSAYTIEKSTAAGFVVKSEAECPIYKNEYKMNQQKEDGAIVRNHEKYLFTEEYKKRLNISDPVNVYVAESGEIMCPAVNDMSEGFVFDSNGQLKGTLNTSGEIHTASAYTVEKSTKAKFIVSDVSKCPIYENEYEVANEIINGGVVRNHQTYKFTKEYESRMFEKNQDENPQDPYKEETYNNYGDEATKSCGNGTVKKIPAILPRTISVIYILIQVSIPIILVVTGMIDLIKSITASKEDEINKARGIFFKRLISAVLVFFVMLTVKLLVSALAKNSEGIINCVECFISNTCDK